MPAWVDLHFSAGSAGSAGQSSPGCQNDSLDIPCWERCFTEIISAFGAALFLFCCWLTWVHSWTVMGGYCGAASLLIDWCAVQIVPVPWTFPLLFSTSWHPLCSPAWSLDASYNFSLVWVEPKHTKPWQRSTRCNHRQIKYHVALTLYFCWPSLCVWLLWMADVTQSPSWWPYLQHPFPVAKAGHSVCPCFHFPGYVNLSWCILGKGNCLQPPVDCRFCSG